MRQTDELAEETLTPELTERRLVYNGDTVAPQVEGIPRGNRPIKKRKRSPFNIVAIVVVVSLLIVVYVWNKLTVNRLAVEINDLQVQYQKIIYSNEILKAEINKKSGLERIGKIAADQLGMIYPKDQPVWFTVSQDKAGHE